jgi:MoxR-like ATPase
LNPDKSHGVPVKNWLIKELNNAIKAKNLYDPDEIDSSKLDQASRDLIRNNDVKSLPVDQKRILNRRIFESAFKGNVTEVDKKRGRPEWVNGAVTDAMINGHWLLLDEFNLAEPGVLERLNPLLDGENKLVITEKNCEVVNAHPDFRVFCTSNPVTYSGRKHMSACNEQSS